MSWATGVMVYLVIWWIILFAVLPLGVRRVENPGLGQDPGAPERPQLLRKAIITTVVAAVLWLGSLQPQPQTPRRATTPSVPRARRRLLPPPLLVRPAPLDQRAKVFGRHGQSPTRGEEPIRKRGQAPEKQRSQSPFSDRL